MFLRTRIEFIQSFFAQDEISEIWITFPDPQSKTKRQKKRLTNSLFLNSYRNFLCAGGIVHLKTDSSFLYQYTRNLLDFNKLQVKIASDDLYNSVFVENAYSVHTFYEKMFLKKGIPIKYLQFLIHSQSVIIEPPDGQP